MQQTTDTPALLLDRLVAAGSDRAARVTHVELIAARAGRRAPWPDWVPPVLVERLRETGVDEPWQHQAEAAEHAHAGRSVIVATGTASGKSLAYQLPALTAVMEGDGGDRRGATVLYLAPTKALAADQARRIEALRVPGVRPACLDGDTPVEERDWIRAHGRYVLTNPDMLHYSVLPAHTRWAPFLRRLRYVVIDECHTYRGVFGAHVAAVIRRLRRVAAKYGAEPVFVLASATVAEPAASAGRLVGGEVVAVTEDAAPRGDLAFALWEPPLDERPAGRARAARGAPVRRSAAVEAAELLADLTRDGARTVAFIRSRRGAELIAMAAREALGTPPPTPPAPRPTPEDTHNGVGGGAGNGAGDGGVGWPRVAAYRAGYLRDERRRLEKALHGEGGEDGALMGLAATTALELGVDIAGLDAVLIAGYPGTRSSLWQQAGRAGRDHGGALAVLIARDDPLDTYLVHHPDALFRRPIESTALDPENPYVLAPHLCAAAAELPLTPADLELFGRHTTDVLDDLVRRGLLRRRSAGWYWTRPERPSAMADLRGSGGPAVRIVEQSTGRLLGTVDSAASHAAVHAKAVYLHQGATYLVDSLDLDDGVALVDAADTDYLTTARGVSDLRVLAVERDVGWGRAARLRLGPVEVTSRIVSFQRRHVQTGYMLGEEPLDLPPRTLRTRAVWWTLGEDALAELDLATIDLAGSAHAAEHASIGILPLFVGCDRWDIGGLSTELHPDTGELTVFVHDGFPGGAGYAERAFDVAATWLAATRDVINACECSSGCPSCVQSPKCGNGNLPLDKSGALQLLDLLLRDSR